MMMALTRTGSLSSSAVRGRRSGRVGLPLLLLLVVHCTFCTAIPTKAAEKSNLEVENLPGDVNVYLVRTKRFEDQRGSSSGYMYKTSGNGGPTSYVQFKTSYGPVKASQPVNTAENVKQQVFALPADLPPITKHLAKKEIDDRDKYSNAEVFAHYEGPTHIETVDDDDDDDKEELQEDVDDYDDGDEDVHYDEGHGSSYEDESSSKQGSKGSSGYSNNESFAGGESGKHAAENTSGSHSSSGGHKASSEEDSGHHAQAHSAGSAEKGGSHSHSESHKKGSKTTGYHKVYRKDEYKKDHTFYDEKDVKGHFDTYGSGHKEHASAEGGFRKGGKHASGHEAAERSEKGKYDKGRYDHHDAGYRASDGHEKYHKDRADYQSADGKHSYREQAD